MESHNGKADDLPPPPPLVAGVEPLKADKTKMPLKPRSLVQRNGFGRKGQPIKLLTNHFKVSLVNAEEFFYHYYVRL
jgi:eukaryotic translation initiation factor 2C